MHILPVFSILPQERGAHKRSEEDGEPQKAQQNLAEEERWAEDSAGKAYLSELFSEGR